MTTIGAADSPAAEVFEYIADVALDAAGDLYVLDGFAHEVRQFGLDGTFRRRFGRKGDGPMEFRDPVAIDFLSSDVLVLAARRYIKFFGVSGPEPTLRATLPAGDFPPPRDMCVIGDVMVVRSHPTGDSHIVHVVGPDGVRRRSFGKGYEHGNPIVRQQVSKGPIACANDPARVIVAFHNLPLVQAYDTAGTLVWETHLPDFVPMQVIDTGNGALEDYSRPADRLLSLASMPGGVVVAHVARLAPADEHGNQDFQYVRGYAFVVGRGRHRDSPARRIRSNPRRDVDSPRRRLCGSDRAVRTDRDLSDHPREVDKCPRRRVRRGLPP